MKRGRCVQCNRRLGSKAEFLFNRPNGSRVYLCGRQSCLAAYNNDVAPNERPQEITSSDEADENLSGIRCEA